MNQFEHRLKAIEERMREHLDVIKKTFDTVDEEKRNLDDRETRSVAEAQQALETLKAEREETKKQIDELKAVDDLSKSLGASVPSLRVGSEPQDRYYEQVKSQAFQHSKSLGELFVDSKNYQEAVRDFKERGGRFATGSVSLEAKGTLLEAAGGGGTGFVSVPQVVPGVVDKLFQRLTFADLLLSGQATTTSVRYVVEGTATSGAAGVAEAGLKPQSTLGVTTTDEPIKKIATTLKVSDEMIEDGPAIQSYINGRLALFVRIEEERQLIRGTSGGNEVQGLLTSRSVPIYGGGTAAGNRAVQLFKAMNGQRGSAFVEPDWIVLSPTDWEAIRLLTDTAGQFFGGGPFQGPYGSGSNVSASGQVSGATDALWGKPVYVTGVLGAGTAIIGSQSSAQVWRRGGLSVEATNSNEDDFLKNLVALRAEERLGLAVYRPTGFVEVRLA